MGHVDSWTEQFEKAGHWWNPNEPEQRVAGVLSYSPSQGLYLRTSGGLDSWFDPAGGDASLLLNGIVQGDYWTLQGCLVVHSSGSGQEIRVTFAFAGVGMDRDEVAQLDEIRFSFEDLWSDVPDAPRRPRTLGRPPVFATADAGEDLSVELSSELVDLELSQHEAFGHQDVLRFEARSGTPTGVDDLIRLAVSPLRDLLAITHRRERVVTYCDVSGPGTTDDGAVPPRARAYVYWTAITTPTGNSPTVSSPFLQIPTSQQEFNHLISRWFELHREYDMPIALRVADLVGDMTFGEVRFILAAQSLEALHRRLHPHEEDEDGRVARDAALQAVTGPARETLTTLLQHAHQPTYRQRVKQLTKEVEDPIKEIVGPRLDLARDRIVETRHNLTHWDPGTEHPNGTELLALRMVADALFDLTLFMQLELDASVFAAMVKRYASGSSANHLLRQAFG